MLINDECYCLSLELGRVLHSQDSFKVSLLAFPRAHISWASPLEAWICGEWFGWCGLVFCELIGSRCGFEQCQQFLHFLLQGFQLALEEFDLALVKTNGP